MHRLGKFQLVAEIARGGMGIVYLAITRGMGGFSKLLVIKELKPEFVEDQTFFDMFLEEARLSARLSHPNIVQTYEVGSDDGRYFMVMDYLDGVPFNRLLSRCRKELPLALHIRLLTEVLQALSYAHTLKDYGDSPLGIVHRDVSPHNVFVTVDGQVKLVDFGVAKSVASVVETRAGVIKGKPAYMAPEQVKGVATPQVDVFAVGLMLWEAVAKQHAWGRQSDLQILGSLLSGDLPDLAKTVPDAPAELVRICGRAMAASPSERYQTAAELRDDLLAYLQTLPSVPPLSDLGAMVAREFEKERAVVDGLIRNASESPSEAVLPSVRLPGSTVTSPSTGSRPGDSSSYDSVVGSQPGAPLVGSQPGVPLTGSQPGVPLTGSQPGVPLTGSQSSVPPMNALSSAPPPDEPVEVTPAEEKSSSRRYLLALPWLLLLLMVGGWVATSFRKAGDSAPSGAPSAGSASSTSVSTAGSPEAPSASAMSGADGSTKAPVDTALDAGAAAAHPPPYFGRVPARTLPRSAPSDSAAPAPPSPASSATSKSPIKVVDDPSRVHLVDEK